MPLIHNNSKFDQFKPKFLERIEILKPLIGKSFKNTDRDKSMMKGSRWNDPDDIFYSFCGDLIEKVAKEKGYSLPLYINSVTDEAVEELMTMDQQEIDVMLIDSMIEAAKRDYWYAYEKDWG